MNKPTSKIVSLIFEYLLIIIAIGLLYQGRIIEGLLVTIIYQLKEITQFITKEK